MGFVKNNSKQNRAQHTAQDDSQSYPTSILLLALFVRKKKRQKQKTEFGVDSTDFGHRDRCCKNFIPENVGERPDSTRSTWRKIHPR
jgi:hypothetical protein